MNNNEKYAFLDTSRIIAVILVLLSHYAQFFNFERLDFIYNIFADIGLGVYIFMVVSGFLAAHSLTKNKNIVTYYINRLIRIVIPFVSTYILLSIVFVIFGIFNFKFLNHVPLMNIIYTGGSYKSILLGMFPLDLNIMNWLGLNYCLFIGEWFIGAVMVLYLFSPMMKYLIDEFRIFSLIIILLISLLLNHFNFFSDHLFMKSPPIFWGYHILDYFFGFAIYIYA